MMWRFILLLSVAAAFISCRKGGGAPALPAMVAEWKIEGNAQAAAPVDKADAGWSVQYAGSPAMKVSVYRMSSGTVAFDALQSWRAAPGQLAFYHGRYFGVVESAGADHGVLNRFVGALERGMPE